MRSGSASTVHSHSSFARRIAARIDVSEVDMPPPQPATGLAPLRKAANSVARSDAPSVESGRPAFSPHRSGVLYAGTVASARHRFGVPLWSLRSQCETSPGWKASKRPIGSGRARGADWARQGRPTAVRHVARVQSLAVLLLLSSC